MNLVSSEWVPVVRRDGARNRIAPWQISESANPVTEITSPRPDFQGGLYQFLIGLLQTIFAPEDLHIWNEYWREPPAPGLLREAFERYSRSFELSAVAGPRFLQDLDLVDGESKPISGLMIEVPGEKTLKDNLDHFVKGRQIIGCCNSCVASALYTLQTNAPAGGVGNRVGYRGGGPLTTLIRPNTEKSTLWQKLWLNILPKFEFVDFPAKAAQDDARIFPWLAPTRLSDKTGGPTFPQDVNALQAYWGMPRRICLDLTTRVSGICDLCGEQSESLFTHYTAKNYGVNYEGPHVHPLTPYRNDPKRKEPPLSLKGQRGGLGYRHWLGLTWKDESSGEAGAMVVRFFNAEYAELLNEHEEGSGSVARLWCFGYDMDNMKARCWYEQHMPILAIAESNRSKFVNLVMELLAAAKVVVAVLRSQVKAAWFSRPKEKKGDTTMIDDSFWQLTENQFFQHVNTLAAKTRAPRFLPPAIARGWAKTLRNTAFELFDQWALEGEVEDMDMKRIIRARRKMVSELKSAKAMKTLDGAAAADLQEEV